MRTVRLASIALPVMCLVSSCAGDGPGDALGGASIGGGGGSSGSGGSDGGGLLGDGAGVAPPYPDGGGPSVGQDAQSDPSCPANDHTQTTFVNLAPPVGAPFDPSQGDPIPGDAGTGAPAGWTFHLVPGAICRDGSPNGLYIHQGTASKLLIYLEGGGACSSQHFCDHNPANIGQIIQGGETVAGSLFTTAGLQAPPGTGIFDLSNAANPFHDWSQVYIPYCTGDVHFGTNDAGTIPGMTTPQHFVGYRNMQRFIGRLVPTFPKVDQVVLTGASAGGFGTGLNFGMVQDAFGSVPVLALDDSGPPLGVQYVPACLQKQWRETWGLDAALPSDCEECRNPDGSGLMDIVTYWHHKYTAARVALVSSIHDEVIGLFFGAGLGNCATDDPNVLVMSNLGKPVYPPDQFYAGLEALRSEYVCTGALSTYYIGGSDANLHQHIWRDRFYQAPSGGFTIAQWTADWLSGKTEQVGP
jgi:hypothetical protein